MNQTQLLDKAGFESVLTASKSSNLNYTPLVPPVFRCVQLDKLYSTNICYSRCDHACTVIGEKFYIMGGCGGERLWFNDLHCFDTGTKTS